MVAGKVESEGSVPDGAASRGSVSRGVVCGGAASGGVVSRDAASGGQDGMGTPGITRAVRRGTQEVVTGGSEAEVTSRAGQVCKSMVLESMGVGGSGIRCHTVASNATAVTSRYVNCVEQIDTQTDTIDPG